MLLVTIVSIQDVDDDDDDDYDEDEEVDVSVIRIIHFSSMEDLLDSMGGTNVLFGINVDVEVWLLFRPSKEGTVLLFVAVVLS